MIELYSVKDVSKIFGQSESRLRYWIQSGFLWPSVRRAGQYFYTFDDLIAIRTAIGLLDSGLSVQKVRKAITKLRKDLPEGISPKSNIRICSDGSEVVVIDDDLVYQAESKQLVMAFAVSSIQGQIADILPIRGKSGKEMESAVPQLLDEEADNTLRQELPSAYQLFLHACSAEEDGADADAEKYLRQCLAQEDSMAAAHTNLGNILYRQERFEESRREYEQALFYEPEQPEARYNLGNLLEEMGKRDQAIAELRQVCSRSPDFADAHYNLGLLLSEVGGQSQAEEHLQRYLKLDPESEWAERARGILAQATA